MIEESHPPLAVDDVRPHKRVVSVSVGSSRRDHSVEVELEGTAFTISREGMNGDLQRAASRIRELDGVVDAMGMGGIDMYLRADGRKYYFREARKLGANARKTPIVDGSGLKGPVEKATIRYLVDDLGLELAGKKALVTSAVDRWGVAEGLREAGCDMVFGDLVYALGIPVLIRSWSALRVLVRVVAPIAALMPFSWLYPTGEAQDRPPKRDPRMEALYRECDVIAGDWQFVKKYLPDSLPGAWIVTNTTTAEDVELCRSSGVELLVTSTPRLEGRSFGTNVIEATMVALDGASGELSPERYRELLDRVGFTPDVRWLQREL